VGKKYIDVGEGYIDVGEGYINVGGYINVSFSIYSSAIFTSNKDRISFVRYGGPLIKIMPERYSNPSENLFVNVAEPNASPHFENGKFVAIIVLFFSYLLTIS